MKLSFLILLFIFFLGISVFAQQQKEQNNSLGFQVGYHKTHLNDALFSPLNLKGGGLLYEINYNRINKNIFGATVKYSGGEVETSQAKLFNSIKTSYTYANVQLEYLLGLSKQKSAVKSYLGVVYNTRILYLDWNDQDSYSFAATHGLSIKALFTKQINKHKISTSITVPNLSLVSRPAYNLTDVTIDNSNEIEIIFNGELSSFNTYKAVDWDVLYQYSFSSKFSLIFGYQMSYQNINKPLLLKQFTNNYTTGISYKF